MRNLARPVRLQALAGLMLCMLLAACLFPASPSKINALIEDGKPAKALAEVSKQLEKNPQDPTLHLLAAKAGLMLCAQQNCPAQNPSALTQAAKHLSQAAPALQLEEGPPLTPATVTEDAALAFTVLTPQPATMVALWQAVPEDLKPLVLDAMFQPALAAARQGNYAQASTDLAKLQEAAQLPKPATTFAMALSGMFAGQEAAAESQIIALRSLEGEIPPTAAALVPWALLAQNRSPENTLQNLPQTIQGWKLSNLLTERAKAGLTHELNTIRTTGPLIETWKKGWKGGNTWLNLTLQRLSLSLNPNQPDIWNIYLPALIQASSNTTPNLTGTLSFAELTSSTLTPATQQQLAQQLLQAAAQLQDQPNTAAPLLVMAGNLTLTNQQDIELDKLTQSLIIKAAEQSNVTATIILAHFNPEVALNNRQVVVPLLVSNIRQNLRTEHFSQAIETAELLASTMQINVQLEPIILQEFADDLKRRDIAQTLTAETPDTLLQPAAAVQLNLGPLYTFMVDYFIDEPSIIASQLTTLIANARGTYGPATAMYRLGALFPEESMPPAKRADWLHQAITEAVINDRHLTGPQTAELAADLVAAHPGLVPAPLLEEALRRTPELADARTIWQHTTPQLRAVITAIRPQFAALMQGIDALEAGKYNAAAQALTTLTDPHWHQMAQPYLAKLYARLADIAGVYVPVSAAASGKTAVVIVSPQGLTGGELTEVNLTFINRLGTLTETDPATLVSTPTVTRRLTLSAPLNFDTMRLALTPEVLMQIPQGGTFSQTYGPVTALALPTGQQTAQGIMQVITQQGGAPVANAYVRTLAADNLPLSPNGTYLIQSALAAAPEGTGTILPPGTVIVLAASISPTTVQTIPLTGSVYHPAQGRVPILIEGTFRPDTLVTEFTFSYPLPASKKPVKAAVRCQALAGSITCGSHHTHSARQQFVALVAGMQTRESLAQSAREREKLNAAARESLIATAAALEPQQPLLLAATPTITPASATQPSPTAPVSATDPSLTITAPSGTVILSATSSAAPPAPPAVSPTQPPAASKTPAPEEEAPLEGYTFEPESPAAVSPTLKDFMPESTPSTVVIRPGEKPEKPIPPGVFIHKTSAKPLADEDEPPAE